MNAVRAKIFIRSRATRQIMSVVEVPIDEKSVNDKLTELRRQYGFAVELDASQVKLAREVMAA